MSGRLFDSLDLIPAASKRCRVAKDGPRPLGRIDGEMCRIMPVIALGLCVGVAVAYGGSSLQAIARKQAKYYGDAHAVITRSETVRIRGARPGHERWTMIQMKGRHPFRVV